jgi:hypothetical protein
MSRKVLVVLITFAAFGWPAGLTAGNEPFLGTWDLDLAASSITRGAPPRIETIVNIVEPGGFRSLLATWAKKPRASKSIITTSTGVSTRPKDPIPGNFHSNAPVRIRSSRIPEGTERSLFTGTSSSPVTARQ